VGFSPVIVPPAYTSRYTRVQTVGASYDPSWIIRLRERAFRGNPFRPALEDFEHVTALRGDEPEARAGICAIHQGSLASRTGGQVREAGHGKARRGVERAVDFVVLLVDLRPVRIGLGDLLSQFHHGNSFVHAGVGA
jgi:hypothetical protein